MLYGNGIQDDTPALQALLDSGNRYVEFPMPAVCYAISRPLQIHSGQELSLPRYCHIRLLPDSNCAMLENKDPQAGDSHITVRGGIWDLNNLQQGKNPIHFGNPDVFMGYSKMYRGIVFDFFHVKHLNLSDFTIKDPVTFGVVLNRVSYFTVENVEFDYNYGNPWAVNMDGIHLSGECSHGVIRNLKGACYDDMVALNADEDVPGAICDILIDGLFAENSHSAVRLLSADYPVKNVTIRHVFGTFYQYCIGITKYYEGENGYFDGIVLDGIFASKAERLPVYGKDGTFVYPLIWVQEGLKVKNLCIRNVHRQEAVTAVETIGIVKGASIDVLSISHIFQSSPAHLSFPLLHNQGEVKQCHKDMLCSECGELETS